MGHARHPRGQGATAHRATPTPRTGIPNAHHTHPQANSTPMSTIPTHLCDGCECRFDPIAYTHHFEYDHCDEDNGIPFPLLACHALHDPCPMNDPEQRHNIGGWNSKQRPCTPLYVLRAGHTNNENGEIIPTTWLTLDPAPPKLRPEKTAPRPPVRTAHASR